MDRWVVRTENKTRGKRFCLVDGGTERGVMAEGRERGQKTKEKKFSEKRAFDKCSGRLKIADKR